MIKQLIGDDTPMMWLRTRMMKTIVVIGPGGSSVGLVAFAVVYRRNIVGIVRVLNRRLSLFLSSDYTE
ncbi:hypothetical protein Hanom_Chr11g01036851 [Helianthus anomalus]